MLITIYNESVALIIGNESVALRKALNWSYFSRYMVQLTHIKIRAARPVVLVVIEQEVIEEVLLLLVINRHERGRVVGAHLLSVVVVLPVMDHLKYGK